MDLRRLELGRRDHCVLIFGAGATRGASFVEENPGLAKPPLDRDFFLQLQRLSARTPGHRELLEGIDREFGPPSERSMENVFSQLIASDEIARLGHRGRPSLRYNKLAAGFLEALVDVFAESLAARRCEHHDRILGRLASGDVVISFNYDCLIDATLARVQTPVGLFDAARSYAHNISIGTQYWGGRPGRRRASVIQLLKPHGSLNWNIDRKTLPSPYLSLRQNPYTGTADGRVIPPIASKNIQDEPYNSVWARARDALATARVLVVIGYSAPDADALAQALIRLHLGSQRQRGLDAVLLVDPSQEVRERFRSLASTAITARRTRVLEFATLAEFSSAFR